jgi:GT2 family glycosyltransferase
LTNEARDHQLACVVVTHNRADKLCVCLNKTLKQDVDLLIVIDNASTDATPVILAELQARDNRVMVERQKRNRGGAWGFARGLRRADQLLGGCGWVLLFDDDSWPEADCIANFHARVSSYQRQHVTAVGSAVFSYNGHLVEANRPVLNLFRRPAEVLMKTLPSSHCFRDLYHVPAKILSFRDQQFVVDSISFVGLFLNLETLPTGKGRYPRGGLFIYSDDTTYTLQLGRTGRKTILDTALVFRHDTKAEEAATPWMLPLWKHYYVVRNSFLMNRALSGFWYGPLCVATIVIHILKGLQLQLWQGDGTLLIMVELGVMDGLRNRYTRPHEELVRRCERR